jgi:hypothetical protein
MMIQRRMEDNDEFYTTDDEDEIWRDFQSLNRIIFWLYWKLFTTNFLIQLPDNSFNICGKKTDTSMGTLREEKWSSKHP